MRLVRKAAEYYVTDWVDDPPPGMAVDELVKLIEEFMPKFSEKSRQKLDTCDHKLRWLFEEVIYHFDCVVLEGHRDEERQNQMVAEGKSQLEWPRSKHNSTPSKAVDVAPYPIDWSDRERFTYFAGHVMGIASQMGIKIRWGGDWTGDTRLRDNRFDDLPHFELD